MENNMDDIMERIDKIKEGLKKSQEDLEDIVLEGTDSKKMVTAIISGKGKLKDIKPAENIPAEKIKPHLIEAVNDGIEKANEIKAERKKKLLGDIEIPDIPGLFE
ncbi:MAG: YbaB/EbfC family nucleoid-associated protein [Halanaerobiales bacterium]